MGGRPSCGFLTVIHVSSKIKAAQHDSCTSLNSIVCGSITNLTGEFPEERVNDMSLSDNRGFTKVSWPVHEG